MAKSFILLGKEAGFAMESPEGMRAWVEAYHATVAPTMAAAKPPTKKKARAAAKGTRSAQRRKKKRLPPHERRGLWVGFCVMTLGHLNPQGRCFGDRSLLPRALSQQRASPLGC